MQCLGRPVVGLRAGATTRCRKPLTRRETRVRAADEGRVKVETQEPEKAAGAKEGSAKVDASSLAKKTAATFAPRASGNTGKNPAVRGTVLYDVFVWQAYLSAAFGGLLAFNVLFPSDHPDVWRLMGMWSIWMLTVPSLRAKECTAEEKSALDILFLAMPIMNVLLPFAWKSFAFVWTMDVILMLGVYKWRKAPLNPFY
ncbi:unnamed protein product [Pedinophyceae sp. YPF-701]|nr:unnamed protein product [Pedinophyceae sp. YPF-701]